MKLNKIFSLFIVLFPILYIYNSGILTLSIADVILIILIPFLLFDMVKNKKKIEISKFLLFITFIIIVQLLFYNLFNLSTFDSVMTTLRIILYYGTCSLFIKEYFDYELGIKYLKKITFIAALYWIIQYVLLNFFGIFIQGTIPFFKTEVDIYNNIMNNHMWTSYAYARPRSFFAEPSHFAVYEAIGLIMYLFKYDSKDKIPVIFVLIAMFLSGSGMAMILTSIIIIIFALKKFKSLTKKKMAILFLILFGVLVLYPFYSKSNSFQTFYNRTFVEKDSTNGRFGHFLNAFSMKKDVHEIILGEGIYKIADVEGQKYITSIPRVYTYFGILGFIIFIGLCIHNFYKLNGIRKYTWILLFAICFSSEILFHNLVMVYLPFIIKEDKNEKI